MAMQVAEAIDKPTRRHKITPADVRAMADLIAKRLNEKEACEVLGIKESTWRKWKSKALNEGRLADLLSRVRGNKIQACMEGIEAAGRKDWRAFDRLLERIDRDRFGDRHADAAGAQPVLQITILTEAIRQVYGGQPQLVASDTPKQLENTQGVVVSQASSDTTRK